MGNSEKDRGHQTIRPHGTSPSFIQRVLALFRRITMSTTSLPSMVAEFFTSPPLGPLSSKCFFPTELWYEHAHENKEVFRSFQLLELRLFKYQHGVEHEVLVGQFRDPTETIFISVERGSKANSKVEVERLPDGNDGRLTAAGAMKKAKRKDERGSSSSSLSESPKSPQLREVTQAEDWFLIIRGPATFNEAAGYHTKAKKYQKNTLPPTARGYLKFNYLASDVTSDVTSTLSSTSTPPTRPSLMNFTFAALAAHRTRLYYTPNQENCYWFANAILYLLRTHFTPSESPIVDDSAGTWSLGPLHIPLGSLRLHHVEDLGKQYERCVREDGEEQARLEQELLEEQTRREQDVLEERTRREQAEEKAEVEAKRAAAFEADNAVLLARINALEGSSDGGRHFHIPMLTY